MVVDNEGDWIIITFDVKVTITTRRSRFDEDVTMSTNKFDLKRYILSLSI